jgi:hypothetical protein
VPKSARGLLIVLSSCGITAGTIIGGAQAQTRSNLQEVLERTKLIVGTRCTSLPWHLRNEMGQLPDPRSPRLAEFLRGARS